MGYQIEALNFKLLVACAVFKSITDLHSRDAKNGSISSPYPADALFDFLQSPIVLCLA